jgi:plasmid maintenance system killer protein
MSIKSLLAALFCLAIIFFTSCKGPASNTGSTLPSDAIVYNNPPADGFDIDGSHPIAVLLADQAMNAMGGRQKWDDTKVLYWNFLGIRTLLWDKQNNRVRIDVPEKNKVTILDMNNETGKSWVDGLEITDVELLKKDLTDAKKIWINDSYWLVMPFKLKDSGVTLSYLREEESMTGERCDVLGLTFQNVGVTPQNGYEIWISIDSRLVKQWAFFKNAEDQEASFVKPWNDYKDFNGLLLAGERGEKDLTDIKVLDEAPKGSFENPNPIQF